jgi:hypothetical protein
MITSLIGAFICWGVFILGSGDYLQAFIYSVGYWCGAFVNTAIATYRKWRLPNESGTIRRQGVQQLRV